MPNLLKVRLSLKGRPIRSYLFDKPKVSIGRDPQADIFLDNTGISRSHAVIERTAGGYVISDLGSSNGTFLNERPIRKEYLGSDDVVHIGKFALWMDIEADRRERSLLGQGANSAALEGTMVIDPQALLDMQRKSAVGPEGLDAAGRARVSRRPLPGERVHRLLPLAGAFLAGVILVWALTLLSRS